VKSICVYCGSSLGNKDIYQQKAKELGFLLAQYEITLIYGGGKTGLMGCIANSVLQYGGKVIGVIPHHLFDLELGHTGLTELKVVDSMHERKTLMADLADGFIAMPGGFGTFEEYCEVVTWNQIGLQLKPCGLLNIENYYHPLISQALKAIEEGFSPQNTMDFLCHSKDPHELLEKLLNTPLDSSQKYKREKLPCAIMEE